MIRERDRHGLAGLPMLLILIGAGATALYFVIQGARADSAAVMIISIVALSLTGFLSAGFFMVNPNEARVLQLFGDYAGTAKTPGLRWSNPFFTKKRISLRVRNFESGRLKVNDSDGNPIEIAAVVVWRVTDTARALFDVDAYQTFVDIQIETAVREIASHFAYDHAEHEEPTLRGDAEQVSALLKEKLQERVSVAGVVIDETKLSHLAYAPEIASAMLRRQQAEAVLAARRYIVQGAVEMVQHALEQLSERDIVKLDDERRAAMVSNLLVVLCGDRDAQPVVNAGSLYS